MNTILRNACRCAAAGAAFAAATSLSAATAGAATIPLKAATMIIEYNSSAEALNFDVKFPAQTGTQLTVSPELLRPGTDYIGEVLAVERGGNQTITEFCFTTAP